MPHPLTASAEATTKARRNSPSRRQRKTDLLIVSVPWPRTGQHAAHAEGLGSGEIAARCGLRPSAAGCRIGIADMPRLAQTEGLVAPVEFVPVHCTGNQDAR